VTAPPRASRLAFERYSGRFLDSVQALSNPDPALALTTLFKGIVANMTQAWNGLPPSSASK